MICSSLWTFPFIFPFLPRHKKFQSCLLQLFGSMSGGLLFELGRLRTPHQPLSLNSN